MGLVGLSACTVVRPSVGLHAIIVGGMPSGVRVQGGAGIASVSSELLISPGWSAGTLVPFLIDWVVVLPVCPVAFSSWVSLVACGVFCFAVVLATHFGGHIPMHVAAAVAVPSFVLYRVRLDGCPWVLLSILALCFA
jgi:hypothetical protein